jgi:hypothetical protein
MNKNLDQGLFYQRTFEYTYEYTIVLHFKSIQSNKIESLNLSTFKASFRRTKEHINRTQT